MPRTTNRDYWRDWERTLGLTIDRGLIEHLYRTQLWADPSVAALARQCLERGTKVAIVSNSTSFWFPRQMRASGLARVTDRLDFYLSHEIGHAKTHPQGGLSLLAKQACPTTTLFVDDRAENIKSAHMLGMETLLYKRDDATLAAKLAWITA